VDKKWVYCQEGAVYPEAQRLPEAGVVWRRNHDVLLLVQEKSWYNPLLYV